MDRAGQGPARQARLGAVGLICPGKAWQAWQVAARKAKVAHGLHGANAARQAGEVAGGV